MSARQRGQEVTVGFSIDGQPQVGSWGKIMDLTITPRTELTEDPFLGESEDDIDVQHHGYDVKFSAQNLDAKFLEFLVDLAARELDHQRPAIVTMTMLNFYREPGSNSTTAILHGLLIKVDDHSFGGRKDRTKTSFSGKCRKLELIAA